jgi:uncharacterized membrane protein
MKPMANSTPSLSNPHTEQRMATSLAQYIHDRGLISNSRALPTSNRRPRGNINVGRSERLLSLLSGCVLAAYGLSQRKASGLLLAGIGAALAYRGATGHCDAYRALHLSSADSTAQGTVPARQSVHVEECITVQKSREELFAFWRRFENLPRIMPHLISVKELDGNRSHWVAQGLTGPIEWDAEVINEQLNEMVAWKSCEGAEVATAGSVHFESAPGNRGTEVRVVMDYIPPAGKVGAGIAWLAGRDPESQIREDLRTLKRVMETGAAPTTEGQPRGTCGI